MNYFTSFDLCDIVKEFEACLVSLMSPGRHLKNHMCKEITQIGHLLLIYLQRVLCVDGTKTSFCLMAVGST